MKKLLALVCMMVSLAALAPPIPFAFFGNNPPASGGGGGDITTGLPSNWRLSEASGSSAADHTGNGNTGTLNAGVSFGGGVATFNGTTGEIDIGSTAAYATAPFTWCFWINTTGTGTLQNLMSGVNNNHPLIFLTAALNLRFQDTTGDVVVSTGTITTGTRYFVAVSCDGSGNYVFYINGVSSGSGNAAFLFTSGHTYLGFDEFNGAFPFAGTMQDVRVYSRVLTGTEMATLYSNGPLS